MTVHVPTHVATGVLTPAARTARALYPGHHDALQLTLALCCALTGTPWGLAMALVVLAVLVARRSARRAVNCSAAVRRGVLPTPQNARPLHAAGRPRQAAASP